MSQLLKDGRDTVTCPRRQTQWSWCTLTAVNPVGISALIDLACGILGGLGLFLLGMKNMSEGMQAVAGPSLRRMISVVTTNRFAATIVGVIVTGVVQSSSVTTVMVVGFVNSGVMELTQGVGVIMGANIGTTVTGLFLMLKIGKFGLPLLGGAAFVYLFSKGDRWRYWAMAFMGVGMVFFGLELMKDACSIIKDIPAFKLWFQRFQADSYPGVLQCALAGCVLTTLVQSSSATLAITISLASQGLIPYETAAALVLGENIGTTITAILASLGATTNARRAAYFHVIFNLVGVFWITLIFQWYVVVIQSIVQLDVTHIEMVNGKETFPNTLPMIAATHTVFNVVNTLLFLPFLPWFVKMLNRFVPSKDFKEKPRLTDLDIRILETPLLAIEQSRKEIEKMSVGCSKMLEWLAELMQQDDPDKALADRLRQREQVLDSMQDEVAVFITNLLAGNVPHSVADEARQQLRMADEYESVSDYIVNLDKFDRKLRRDGHRFTPEQREGLADLNRQVADYLAAVNEGLAQNNRSVLTKTDAMYKRSRTEIKQLRRQHLEDLSNGSIAPLVSVAYMATLNAYARVRDHSHNIAEVVSGEK
ncbi:MAG: Na/Pi cotransporter family protein [Fuerstiella sp.]